MSTQQPKSMTRIEQIKARVDEHRRCSVASAVWERPDIDWLLERNAELLGICKEVLAHFAGTVDDHVALPIGYARYQKLKTAIAAMEKES